MAKKNTGALLERALSDAERYRQELRRARGDVRRYKGKAAKTKARNRAADAERKLDRAVDRVDKYATVAAKSERRKERAKPVEPKAEGHDEWEIGFNYEGSRRLGNSVNVNFRVMKIGGGTVTEKQATEAVRVLHGGGKLQDVRKLGLHVEAVDWQRPGWKKPTDGKPGDLMSFSGIMQTVFMGDFRINPPKKNRL